MSIELQRLDSRDPGFDDALARLTDADLGDGGKIEEIANEIIDDVRARGDAALVDYTNRFDDVGCTGMAELVFDPADFESAFAQLAEIDRQALEHAAARIDAYHQHQRQRGVQDSWDFEDADGNRLGQRVTALDRVGIYIPGGQAAYPSTVLMTVIPAKVAGVQEIVVTMPTPGGVRNALAMAALHLTGVTEGYAVGGAQAIAALAYGTESVRRVDKIVGPGGAFVAAAKRRVYGAVGIDMIAGPSEILIVTDGSAPIDWLVYDLFSQAEHDALAQSLLLCPDAGYLDAVAARVVELLDDQARTSIIARSLADRGALIRTRSLDEAIQIANRIAPEHLELAVADPDTLLAKVKHAGAIFLGMHSAEVMGDYAAGPSHVLPTYGTARFSSPLGVYDFQKRSSVIGLSAKGAEALARTASVLAHGEGLEAHARAAEARIDGLDHNDG